MVQIGFHSEGCLNYPLKELENGWIVPDASVSEVHRYHRDLLRNQIELTARADALGYDYAFHPENHFTFMGSNSPAPVQIQTAIAERTDEIRLVQMANSLPWHDPIRLAERLAVLDIVSDERLDVGIATGSGELEAATFGRQQAESADDASDPERFEEQYELLLEAWTEDVFSHHGPQYDLPPDELDVNPEPEYHYFADDGVEYDVEEYVTGEAGERTQESVSVFPQPEQEPHPQLWRACGSKQSATWAARRGINACTYGFNFSSVESLIETYYAAAEAAEWPDRRPSVDGEPFHYGWDEQRRRGVVAQIPMFNTEVATEEAFERWKRGHEFLVCLGESDEEVSPDAEEILASNDAPVAGSSEELVDTLAVFEEECGYEGFMFIPTFVAPGMKKADKLDQLHGFVEHVTPYFEDESAA